MIGRRNIKGSVNNQFYAPRRIKGFGEGKVAFVASHCSAAHSIIIMQDGTVYTLGKLDFF